MAYSFPIGLCLLGLAGATDYFVSPGPKHGDKSLEACLALLKDNDKCLLRSGHYFPVGTTTINNAKSVALQPAEADGEVIIDGTSELTGLQWKTCAEEDANLICAPGVYVAQLGGESFSQLFFGGKGVNSREMLVPARWPNANSIPTEAVDAPPWAGIFDSATAWSFPDGSNSGRVADKADTLDTSNRVPGDYAKFVDAGGTIVSKEVEVEDDDFETVTRSSPAGFLADANLSVKGANIIITYGKGGVEQGVVKKHRAGSNNFEFHHPQCAPGGYGSCGKGFWKTEFTSYFFENALQLLDQEKEYYFELNASVGNRLFLKAPGGAKPSLRLWARHSDFFLNIVGSNSFTVKGIKTFATGFTTVSGSPNPGFQLLDNTFLYPTAVNRFHGVYRGYDMYFHNADGALFSNNIWRYAEGGALDAKGQRMTMEDNLFEYNGIYCTSGPETVKWSGKHGKVRHNTLRWNGHVTGWKLMGENQTVMRNHIEHQNWGELLHDGAGIHVQMSAGASTYKENWVHDGHHSLGIRFDTAKTSVFNVPEDVGHDGQVHHNVLWGKSIKLAMKGERHNITKNTIVEGASFTLIRAFGVQQGMNELTVCEDNALEIEVAPRGKKWDGRRRSGSWVNEPDDEGNGENRAKGDAWGLPPLAGLNGVDKDLCWDGLRDCTHRDFRPRDAALNGKGAYEQDAETYWIPGRRTNIPEAAVPLDGATDVSFNAAALIFKAAKGCDSYTVFLKKAGVAVDDEDFTGGKNVWNLAALERGETYEWTVKPSATAAGCEDAISGTFTFTAATEERTTTTTTTPDPCFDAAADPDWCTAYKTAGKCHRNFVKKDCQKTCGFCTPATGETTTTDAPTATTAAPPACSDSKGSDWCAGKNCGRNNVQNGCQQTCGLCTVPTTTVTTTTAAASACSDSKGSDWCAGKNCGRNNVKNGCQKTCGLCTSLEQDGAAAVSSAMATTVTACFDSKEGTWCEDMESMGKCTMGHVKSGCRKTCGICASLEQDKVAEVPKEESKPRGFLARALKHGSSMMLHSAEVIHSTFFSREDGEDGEDGTETMEL